jgi:transposase
MLRLPPSVRIFVCTQIADMRRGFDGLAAMVNDILRADPLSGHLFVFRNRRGDRLKILFWDRDGFVLYYKRLERGRFLFPRGDATCVEMDATELMLLLEGIDLTQVHRPKRFRLRR